MILTEYHCTNSPHSFVYFMQGIKLQSHFKRPSTFGCGVGTYMGLEYGSATQPCSSNTSATTSTSVSEKELMTGSAYARDYCESPRELPSSPVGISPSPPINQISFSPFSAPHRRVSQTSARKKSAEAVVFPKIEFVKSDLSSRFQENARELVSTAIVSPNQEVDINDGMVAFPELLFREELPCRERASLRIETSDNMNEYGHVDAFHETEVTKTVLLVINVFVFSSSRFITLYYL